MSDFDKFMYRYLIFLSFVIFVIGISANDLFGTIPEIGGNFRDVVGSSRDEIMNQQKEVTSVNVEGASGFWGWIHDIVNFSDWWEGSVLDTVTTSFRHFAGNLWYFFQLTTMDTGVAWLTSLIFAPAGIFIFWKLITLMAPGG